MVEERISRLADEGDGVDAPDRFASAYSGGPSLGTRLRSIAIGTMLGLATIGGTGTALAQESEEDGEGGAVTEAPAAGMSVEVEGEEGTAQLTVYGIKDTGIPTETEDGPGRFVLVDLRVANAGDAPFLFNTTRVRMHDEEDRDYSRVRFDNDDDPGLANFSPLRGQELDDEEEARGWLAFAVEDDSTLRTVSYRDDDGDDVGIADLTVASVRLEDDGDWDDDGLADASVNNVAATGGTGTEEDGAVAGGGGVSYCEEDGGVYYGGDDGWEEDGGAYYGEEGGGAYYEEDGGEDGGGEGEED